MENRPYRKNVRLKNYDYSSNGMYFITICVDCEGVYLSDIVLCDDANKYGYTVVGDAALGVPSHENKNVCDIPNCESWAVRDARPYENTNVWDDALGVPNTNTNGVPNTKNIYVHPNVILTEYGKIVNENIIRINQIYKYVSVLNYVIMPDHIHMIIFVSDFDDDISYGKYDYANKSLSESVYNRVGTPRAASPTKSVSQIINGLKSISTKQIGFSIWQRSYHDHIIRNENEFRSIWQYIDNNPINWANRRYNTNCWR